MTRTPLASGGGGHGGVGILHTLWILAAYVRAESITGHAVQQSSISVHVFFSTTSSLFCSHDNLWHSLVQKMLWQALYVTLVYSADITVSFRSGNGKFSCGASSQTKNLQDTVESCCCLTTCSQMNCDNASYVWV